MNIGLAVMGESLPVRPIAGIDRLCRFQIDSKRLGNLLAEVEIVAAADAIDHRDIEGI